jgi:hypothetical protein
MSMVRDAMVYCSRPDTLNIRPSTWTGMSYERMHTHNASPKLARDWAVILANYVAAFDMMVQARVYHQIIQGRPYKDAAAELATELNKWAGYGQPATA